MADSRHGLNEDSRGFGLVDLARAIREGPPAARLREMAFHVCEVMHGILASKHSGQFAAMQSSCAVPPMLPEISSAEVE